MCLKSLAIEEELGRKEGMASQYGNLGILYGTRGELEPAEEMYRKSLAINEELGRKEGMANQYGNLGSLYLKRGELKRAASYVKRCLALFRELGATDRIAQAEELLRQIERGEGVGAGGYHSRGTP